MDHETRSDIEPASSAADAREARHAAEATPLPAQWSEPEPPSRRSPPAPTADEASCPVCLERIAAGVALCPECGEPTDGSKRPVRAPSVPDAPPDASWLSLHWRPLVTIGAILGLISTGGALRYLAPHRFAPSRAASAVPPPAPVCGAPCWSGESCQLGRCVWQRPNNVGHLVDAPSVAGPFSLPKDAFDALPLDRDRFAVALSSGLEVRSSRTGEALSLVTEAPNVRRLHRVGEVVYATSPSRIYVIDAATTRLLKTIELGEAVGDIQVGASGRRVLASLPEAHAVAILATEYHAEIERIQFGDDPVGPVAVDDSGTRAITTTGQLPLPGQREPASGGVAYPFDPSRLGSEQDRVRTSMVGNPASALMSPDGSVGFVALRAENTLVPLTWLPSGAVRQEARITTCREPEQMELVRSDRRVLVRCNEGRAIQVFDLSKRELLRAVTFPGRALDMAVAPDGAQAVVALSGDGAGSVALIDLKTYAAKVHPLGGEPTRIRLAPDGGSALALGDRAKVAWVLQ
ncbi:YncE family protein [Sorangium sp. So ce385]|uniref:YncE family protein n=1 Tax=Sorangium sp. So ce385 TaxID=3133308 RepID=UPI003F5B9643